MRSATALAALTLALLLTGCQSAGRGADFTMPNEVGKGLQEAQDDLQGAADDPVYGSTSSDATGQGRTQILDRDWQVCSQTPAPGSTVKDAEVPNFAVVRTTERCPRGH